MVDCLFCKIAQKKAPAEIVYEDEDIIAFNDIKPSTFVYILVIPKKHIEKLQDISDNDKELLGKILLKIKEIAKEKKIDKGYKVQINCGKDGGQLVPHLHFHLLGGFKTPQSDL